MSPPPHEATTTITVPGRGRGRVVPRKRDDGTTVPTAAAAAALVPAGAAPAPRDVAAERALALGQAPWRARRSLRSGGVARFSSIAGATQALRRGLPVVLVGARLSSLALAPSASSAAAAGASGGRGGGGEGGSGPGVSIFTSAPGLDRFFEFDAAKNADPGAYYHVRYPEMAAAATESSGLAAAAGSGSSGGRSGNRNNSLSEWLARASSWVETRTLCRALLGVWGQRASLTFRPNAAALRQASRALLPPAQTGGVSSKQQAPAPARRLRLAPRDLLDWPRVQELLAAMLAEEEGDAERALGGGSSEERRPQQQPPPPPCGGSLWLEASNPAAGRAALLPMRAQPFARVVAQVSGRRRAVLVDPSMTYGGGGGAGGLRPYPFAHALEGYSGRSWEEGDEDEDGDEGEGVNKGAVPVRGAIAELGPGDALVVPAFWWAHQELLQPAGGGGGGGLNVALELGLDGGAGEGEGGGGGGGGGAAPLVSPPLSAGALRAQAARLAEGLLAASLGAPAVARCLAELAAAAGGPPDPSRSPLPPPPTARAHDRAVACGAAFDALVEACLAAPPRQLPGLGPLGRLLEAEAQARALCAAMAGGGRLRPSQALDAAAAAAGARRLAGAAPEAATLMPRRWLIEEDAEAARFPTLFRHRLLGAREDWKRHATELPMAPMLHVGRAPSLSPPVPSPAPLAASAPSGDEDGPLSLLPPSPPPLAQPAA